MKSLLDLLPWLGALFGTGILGAIWRTAYKSGQTVQRIESLLLKHEELHEEHKDGREKLEERLRKVEVQAGRHSEAIGALQAL